MTTSPVGQGLPAGGPKPSLVNRLRGSAFWQSIFRQGYPNTDENRALVMFNTFFLHLHPVKVQRHSLKVTYTFGLGVISAFLFLLLTVTGGILMFLYVPSVDRAYGDMQALETSVAFGMMLRNLHRWGGHLMVLVVFLHMCRVFFTGGHKSPRQFNWMMGVLLWVVTLLLSFSGYLLPYDQLSYWAITVGTNIAAAVPIFGDQIRLFLLGAPEVGQPALQRFYALHIFVLPALMTVMIGVHLWRIRKDGGLSIPQAELATPYVPRPSATSLEKSTDRGEVFPHDPLKTYGLMSLMKRGGPMVAKGPENTVFSWPHLLVMELLAVLGTTVLLLLLSLVANAPLRGMADPDITENPAKAPWFFSSLQELLLHMSPALAGFFIPAAVIVALMALPYLDRSQEDVGVWFASRRGRNICLWSAVYATVASIGLVLFDEFVGVRTLVAGSPFLVGWVVPIVVIGGLMAVLYLGLRRWRPDSREIALAYFAAFVATYFVLTIVTQFFRGYGMHLIPFWQIPPGGLTF